MIKAEVILNAANDPNVSDEQLTLLEEAPESEFNSMDILPATEYSSPHDVITSDKYDDGSYGFFDKSDKEVVGDLRYLYPEFIFKQKFVGEGGGLQAVEISTKDGKHTAQFDVGVGDIYNLYGAPQYLSKTEGRNKSFKILNDFLNEYSTIEGQVESDKAKIERNEIRSKTNTKRDELAATEINEIETAFEDGSLFEVTEKTTYALGGKMGYTKPQKLVIKDRPYEKELKLAFKQLKYDLERNGEDRDPTLEETQLRAKENIINKIQDEKLEEVIKSNKFQGYSLKFGGTDEKIGERQVKYDIATIEFDQDLKRDLATFDHNNNDIENSKETKDFLDLKTKLEDINYKFEIPGKKELDAEFAALGFVDENSSIEKISAYNILVERSRELGPVVILEDGRTAPEHVTNEFERLRQGLLVKSNALNDLRLNIMERSTIHADNNRAQDIARRNYNGMEEFLMETGLGLTEQFLVNIPYGLSTIGKGYDKSSADAVLEIKNTMQKIRDSYSKDVEFDDAFKSLGNFGSFFAQEVSNQIPIYAALAMPGGLAMIGTSAFGDQYSNLVAEERTLGGRKLSNNAKYWNSMGFMWSEMVFEGLTTLPLIRAAKRGLRDGGGITTMFDMNFKKYFLGNIGRVGYHAVAEPIGEGLTQFHQNWIDGKPLTEGLDHAMFSGLMLGTTLSAAPFAKGLYTASMNDHVEMQQIRSRVNKMTRIKRLNDQLSRNLNLGTKEDQKRRKKQIKNNDSRFKELWDLNVSEMNEMDTRLKGLESIALFNYFAVTQQQENIKNEAQRIEDDTSLSEVERNERLKELKIRFDEKQATRDFFRNKKTFGNAWGAFAGNDENISETNRIRSEAENVLKSEGNKEPSKAQIEDKSRIIYNSELIRKDHKKNKNNGVTKSVLVETADEADVVIDEFFDKRINQLNKLSEKNNVDYSNQIKALEKARKAAKKGLKKGNHGVTLNVNFEGQVGRPVENLPIHVVENQAKDDRIETRTHEVGHDVTMRVLGQDPRAYDELASMALNYLQEHNPDAYNRIVLKLGDDVQSDEVMMLFFEEVAANKVNLSKNSIGGLFGFLLNKGIKKGGGVEIDFKGETDAVNFLVGLAKKIKDGTINNEDIRNIKQNILIKEAKKKAKPVVGIVPKFSEARAKENLKKLQDAPKYDPDSPILARELPGMVKAQITNYFAARPKLKVDNNAREELQAEIIARLYMPSERTGRSDVNGFDGRGTLYGYLNGRIKWRMLDAFEQNPTIVPDYNQKQIEEERTRLQKELDETTDLDNVLEEDTDKITKVNVLQIGKIAGKQKEIRKVVKVKKGDTHKEVTDNNKGRVGNIIFGIPENKISDPKANITTSDKIVNPKTGKPVKKGETGTPQRSEATNIQDYFADINTTKKFIQILNPTNVSEKDADINKLGENIDVSRDVYGRAIGLPNRILEYFYNKKFKPDGKRVRSQGLTSQVGIWELKPEFRNLNDKELTKAAEQFQRDLGITEKQEVNKLPTKENRSKIGQLLKGAAAIVSQQVSLSMAQRKLEGFPELVRTGALKMKKQEIADITAAQPKIAFSERVDRIKDLALNTGKLKWNGKKIILAGRTTYYLETEKDGFIKGEIITRKHLDEYQDVKNEITWEEFYMNELLDFFKSQPQYYNVTRTALTGGVKKAAFFTKDYFNKTIKKFAKKNGKQDIMKLISKTKQVGPKRLHYHEKSKWKGLDNLDLSKDDGKLEFLINFYSDISKHVAKEGKGKEIFQEVLTHFGIDQSNPMRHGAVVIAYPVDPKTGNEYKVTKTKNENPIGVEEHAVQMEMARIMMGMAFEGNMKNANKILKAVYSQISLRKNEDPGGTYKESMGEDFYNDVVPRILNGDLDFLPDGYVSIYRLMKAGVNPFGYKLINENKTIAEYFGVNNLNIEKAREAIIDVFEGKQDIEVLRVQSKVPLSKSIDSGKTLSDAMRVARTTKFSETSTGITVLDFDDALVTTESLVRYTAPDGTKGTLNAEEYALQNMLDQFDVKSKVQQAKVKFSKSMNKNFNDILENVIGIESKKRYSAAKARKRGEGKGRFRFFMPPSHEDFAGLLYNFIGKGEKGNQHRDFFEQALIKPLNRAYTELNAAKQTISNDYRNLIKKFPDVRKKLTKKTPDGDYVYSDAVRVYLWDKFGIEIPGMVKTDQQNLVNLVKADPELQAFADAIGLISKQKDGYIKPTEEWEIGDIRTDLAEATVGVGRHKFFEEFIENADVIFSKENLNKIEAAYGKNFREALEDMLYKIRNGRNRPSGNNRLVNRFTDWINGSVGATMFLNRRSGILQQLSIVNFINYGDNNIFKAAAAFANQIQYWKDYATIFNSDFLKQRRKGIAFDVNGAELAQVVSKSKEPFRAAMRYLLQKGFILTQIGDSNAIAMGGATFYRNRVNTYLKQGLSQKEAEAKAWTDFTELAEMTQQSARPDMVSQQQSSPLGKFVLAFQNVTSQYNRIMKKAGLDLINRRMSKPYNTQWQSDMSNISRIIYYGAIQNAIFYGLQTALFAMAFSDDDEDQEFFEKKRDRVINGSIDSLLRGMGVGGAIISTLKNTAMKIAANQDKKWGAPENILMQELLQLSPPIGIKSRRFSSAEKTYKYNKKVIKEMETFDIDNPIWESVTQIVQGVTNAPTHNLHRMVVNTREALNAENEWWQRLFLGIGWNKWELGVEDREIEAIKKEIKDRNKIEAKQARIQKLLEQYPGKNLEEIDRIIKGKEIFDLNKKEQLRIIESLDVKVKGKMEKDRVEAMLKVYDIDTALVNQAIRADKKRIPTKSEEISIELFNMNKKEQVNLLMELGLSSERIRVLKYEEDRVKKIIQLQKKVKTP